MIAVTERAKEALVHLRTSAESYPPGVGLRLAPGAMGQMEMFADTEREGDQVVTHEGMKLLLISEEVSHALSGLVIDYRSTPEGPQLVLEQTGSGENREGPR